MKYTVMVIFMTTALAVTSCSSTRDTKRADPRGQAYIPERHKNQDEDAKAPGHQKDEVREDHMK